MSLLGHLLELHSGLPYARLVDATICQPLGLADTTITLSTDQHHRLIGGYSIYGQRVPNWDFLVMAPGGAFRSTVHDLLTFVEVHLTQPPDGLIPAFRRAHETHFTHTTFDVGLAWIVQTRGENHVVHWHNGGTGGYVSFLGMDKRHHVGIVILSNYGDASVANSASYDVDTMGFTLLEELARSSG